MACIFCELIRGNASISEVFRDQHVLAFMDIQPINPGHVLVIPVAHAACLGELDPEVGAHLFRTAQRVANAIRESAVRAEGVNLFLADGEAAGQEVPHVHLHVFPRFQGDGFRLRFGPNYSNRPRKSEIDAVARKLSTVLELNDQVRR